MSIRGKELADERNWANGNIPIPVKDEAEKDFITPMVWIFTLAIVGGCGAIYWVFG